MKVESSFANINNTLAGKIGPSNSSKIAIDEGLKSQSNGHNVATNNIKTADNAAKVAQAALGTINDSLQSIRELALQASNGTLTGSDKTAIQSQIDQFKESIQDVVKNTNFNTKKLLDGSFEANIQTGPNSGQGQVMKIDDSSLETLGINNFDVTGEFDLKDIDSALEQVTSSRSKLGATSNRFEFAASVNNVSAENLESARSTLKEDIATQVSELNKNKILDQFKLQMQQQRAESKNSLLNLIG
ncbi:MAG: flagellin [Acidaminobacteraceae bacterium]